MMDKKADTPGKPDVELQLELVVWVAIALVFATGGLLVFLGLIEPDTGEAGAVMLPGAICLAGSVIAAALMYHRSHQR
jgi:hypothetical protein